MKLIKNYFCHVSESKIFCTAVGDFNASDECVIYFSPLFEERMWVQRIAFNYALELWDRIKMPVVLFDYPGYGESDGEPEDFTIEKCVDTLAQIKGDLKQIFGIKQYNYWGIRSGAHLALNCLNVDESPKTIVMWMPVYDMQKYIDKELRTVISFQFSVYKKILVDRKIIMEEVSNDGKCERDIYHMNNIDGYRFGKDFINEIFMENNAVKLDRLSIPTLILEALHKKRRLSLKNNSFFENLKENDNIYVNDVETHPFWQYTQNYSQKITPVFEKSLNWYRDQKND